MTLSTSILATLDDLADRHEELSALLGESETVSNREKFTTLSKEYSELEPIIERYRRIAALRGQLDDAQLLLEDDDTEMRKLASGWAETAFNKAKHSETISIAHAPTVRKVPQLVRSFFVA